MQWLVRLAERRSALLATLVLLLAYAPASRTGVVRDLEGDLFDLRLRLQPNEPVSDAIALVLIDDASIREIGRWPWSRGVLAELVAAVDDQDARTIGIDLLFTEPERAVVPATWLDALLDALSRYEAEGAALDTDDVAQILGRFLRVAPAEEDLARVLDRAGNVVVPFSFEFLDAVAAPPAPAYVRANAYRIARAGPDQAAVVLTATGLLPPIAAIGEAAAGLGHTNVGVGADGTAHFEYPVVRHRDRYYPSFAIETVRAYLGLPRERVALELGRGIRLGERFVPTDASMRMVVNYRRPGRFTQVSAAAVLNGEVPRGLFRDKVVLIGGAAAGVGGRFASPFGTEIPGVERQAAVIDGILSEDFVVRRGSAALLGAGYLFLGGLLLGAIASRYGVLGANLLLALLLAGLIASALFAFLQLGLWLDLFLPLAGLVLIWAAVIASRYLAGLRQQRALRTAFQHYLNPDLVDRVSRDPALLRLGGEEKELTVLFADIRNSTRIAARLPPAEFVQLLNDYFAAMTGVVFAHEAMLDKYVGDGMVVIFGAPLARPDHALRACEAALAMQDALRPVQERWARPGLPPLQMGIGINTGPMIIGNMGSAARFDYTVIGDEANLGARLEAANKEFRTRILISEATFRPVEGRIAARELDVIRFRGMERPVRVYEVLGREPLPEPQARRTATFAAGLAAYRAGELDRAREIFERVRDEWPDDYPAEIYVRRCRERLEGRPPPEGFAL